MDSPPKLWTIFATYVLAAVGIIVTSLLAALVLRLVEPDLPDAELVTGLSWLVVGGVGSSTALALTVLVAASDLSPARLGLIPGRETGLSLVVMIAGVLSLGQALDSLVTMTGLAHQGSVDAIRHALEGASGPNLFVAVIVIAFLAGSAEELFFRGYMQTQLRAHWRPSIAIVVTSACFGLLHGDWIHTPLAFALGLYLGFVRELSGSALPAIACHVVNNAVFTMLTALVGSLDGFWPNLAMFGFTTMLFVVSVAWLTRTVPWTNPPGGQPG